MRASSIKNDTEFISEISEIEKALDNHNDVDHEKGAEMAIQHFKLVRDIVTRQSKLVHHQKAFSNLLPILEFKGGKEFLETSLGKRMIEVFFYFANDFIIA